MPTPICSRIRRACASGLLAGAAATAAAGGGDVERSEYDVRALEYPALGAYEPPRPERLVLDNGLTVFLLEDHELPQVKALARVGAGAAHDPPRRVGLAGLTATVLRTGGTESMSPEAINRTLEGLGAQVETGSDEISTTVYMSSLVDGLDRVLPIFADLVQRPAFAADKLALEKRRRRSAIARRNDQPQQIAFREFPKLVHGADSPYARHPEHYTIAAVEREHVAAFHQRHYHPDNMLLSVWGDFDTESMKTRLRELFGDWRGDEAYRASPLPDVDAGSERSVALVARNDINQSTVLIGHPGRIRRDHEDYPAVQVMNQVLSGGFTGRLFRELRSEQGLAYSVFGRYTAPFYRPGLFYAGIMTKSSTTVRAARELLTQVEAMRAEPPGESELELAREAYLNSFVFELDSKREILQRRMAYAHYDYPEDFLERTRRRIQAVTAEDVHRVARRYLRPSTARILIVGNPDAFSEDPEQLGEIERLDVSIPQEPPDERGD